MHAETDKNPVALVTGSSRGIGRAIALTLAQNNWNVVINYRKDEKAAREAAHQAETAGARTLCVCADISNDDDRRNLVNAIQDFFGRLDLLVNNAGMSSRKRVDLLEVSQESFDEVMAANIKGPFFLTQTIASWMIKLSQSGLVSHPRIINIGSISAYTASTDRAEYCLSKAAMAMMTMLYSTRLAESGIQVFELRPGIIETDMTSVAKPKYDRLISEGLTPIQRWGQPEDVARAVLAIAGGYLDFSTGEVINIDGGFHLRKL